MTSYHVASRIMTLPKISTFLEPVTMSLFHGKRDFADVIKSRILKPGDIQVSGSTVITGSSEGGRRARVREVDVTAATETG